MAAALFLQLLLLQFNPVRSCERNFHKKYLVGDVLKARCGAAIRVELVDNKGCKVTDSPYSNCEYEVGRICSSCSGEVGWGGVLGLGSHTSAGGTGLQPC
jgi:hypothetical protein